MAEAIEHQQRPIQIDAAQDDHELLAADPKQRIAASKCIDHGPGEQQQHFVAVQVAEFIVNSLEVIDVYYG